MVMYLSIAFALFTLALGRQIGCIDRRYEIPLALCLTLAAYAVSFLRWQTGTDWSNYFAMYQSMTSIANARAQSWWEPAYSYTAVAINYAGGSYTIFLCCMATILFAVKFRMLVKSCSAPLVAIFVLFCANFFDIFFVRQQIATVFLWAFVYYYWRRRYVLAWSAAIASVGFHYSAALPIAIVMLAANLEWKRVVLLLTGAVCASYIALSLFSFNDLSSLTTLGAYLGTGWIEVKSGSALSTTLRAYMKLAFWFWIVIAGYIWFYRGNRSEQMSEWSALCLRCGAGVLLVSVVLVPISQVFARMPAYAVPLFAVVLSNYRFNLRRITVGGAAYLSIIGLLFVELVFLYRGFPRLYYPIKWVFS